MLPASYLNVLYAPTSLILTIFITPILPSVALTVEQAKYGKVAGFLGDGEGRTISGDTTTNHFCYCYSPDYWENPDRNLADLGHVYTIEYYNWHSDTTFILYHECLARHNDAQSQMACNMKVDERGIWAREETWRPQDYLARSWQREHDRDDHRASNTEDVLKYIPQTSLGKNGQFMYDEGYSDYLSFNNQWRNVGKLKSCFWRKFDCRKWGRDTSGEDVQDFCQGTCQGFLGMDVAPLVNYTEGKLGYKVPGMWLWPEGISYWPSHEVVIYEMDDMCPSCK